MTAAGDEDLLSRGVAAQQAGRLDEAERLYRTVAEGSPAYPYALHYLGWLAHVRGDYALAVERFRAAIALDGGVAQFHCNLGNSLSRLGRYAEAEDAYRQAEALAPELIEVGFNRGILAERQGDWAGAEARYRRLVEREPAFAPAVKRLAALLAVRQPRLAEQLLDRHAACFGPHIAPARAEVLMHAAQMLEAAGNVAAAIEVLTRATSLVASDAELWARLGQLYLGQGFKQQAWEAYKRAHRLAPDSVAIACGAGSTLADSGRPERAIELLREALRRHPQEAALHDNLGNALRHSGRLAAACDSFAASLAINDADAGTWSNRLLTALARDDVDAAGLLAMAAEFGHRFAPRSRPARAVVDALPAAADAAARSARAGRLRVGILSADLNRHPVGYFMRDFFRHADRDRVEIVAFSTGAVHDGLSDEMRGHCQGWHAAKGDGDDALRARIRAAAVDVLVELSGHTAGNRLPVLAERVAPVQVNFLGYAGTTGVPGFDARIGDWHTEPAGAEAFSSEPLLRMDGSYFCYGGAEFFGLRPSRRSRQPGDPVRFGYFGQRSKVTDTTLRHWLLALAAHPKSRLIVRCQCFVEDASVKVFREQVRRCGGDPSRFDAKPWAATKDYAAVFDEVDVILNAYPFHLATNMCDALLAGVPVVSYLGVGHRARMGLSIGHAAGVPQYCGGDDAGYLAAVEAALRDAEGDGHRRLADNVARSPLLDGPGFAKRLVATLERCMDLKDCR